MMELGCGVERTRPSAKPGVRPRERKALVWGVGVVMKDQGSEGEVRASFISPFCSVLCFFCLLPQRTSERLAHSTLVV